MPRDYRQHHSLRIFLVARAAAYSASKNNRTFAKRRLPRTASRSPYPKTDAPSRPERLRPSLKRRNRRLARTVSGERASASQRSASRAAAPSSLARSKRLGHKSSRRQRPAVALQTCKFVFFSGSSSAEYNRYVAFQESTGAALPNSHRQPSLRLSSAKARGILKTEPAHSPRGIKPCQIASLCAWPSLS